MQKGSQTRTADSLLQLAEGLLEATGQLRPLRARSRDDPRERIRLLLRLKVLPELSHGLALPVFVGVQGGTNTGKSTVFNALSRKLLSPSVVVASATKHPLLYLHAKWQVTFFREAVFPGIQCRELEDPKDLLVDGEREDLLYFRFHETERLLELALIDSPDFDSSFVSNAVQAARIAAISDVTLYVTSAQKYRDRVLLDELRRLLRMKAQVMVVFNMVEEEIVFETLVDDLREALREGDESVPAEALEIEAVRLPPSRGRHPEEELSDLLADRVLEPLFLLRGAEIKPAIMHRTLRRLLSLVEELLSAYSVEAEFKKEIRELADAQAGQCLQEYPASSRLSFPEETLAIRKAIGLTELGPHIRLSPEVEKASKLLGFVGASARRLNDTLRRVLVRLARSDEGALEASQTALGEYAENRNKADSDQILRLVETARVNIESRVRDREEVSALARELMRGFFTSSHATGFASEVRKVHAEKLKGTGDSGEEWLPTVEEWIRGNRGKVRALSILANVFKIGVGVLVAWALPPARGAMAFLSPLKWLYFGLGFFLGAYIVALLICLRLRRRRRFERARREAMKKTLETVLMEPLHSTLDDIIADERLHRIRKVATAIATHPDFKAQGPSPSPPEGGSGKSS